MAMPDPLIMHIGEDDISIPRVSSGENRAVYRKDTGMALVTATVSHQYGKRTRRAFRVQSDFVTADPILPSTNLPVSASVTLVLDVPKYGFDEDSAKAMCEQLFAHLTASSGVQLSRFVGGES